MSSGIASQPNGQITLSASAASSARQSLRIHKYLPIAIVLFFLNAPPFFPQGLLVTGLLSPLFYLWLLLNRRRYILEVYFAFLGPFLCMNVIDGIRWPEFLTTSALLLTAYVTVVTLAVAIKNMRHLHALIGSLILINFAVAVVGAIIKFTPYYQSMWQLPTQWEPYQVARFKAFTYEASYYSTLLVPLVLFSYWSFVSRRTSRHLLVFLATLIPLFMSLSFGTIGALVAALVIAHCVHHRGNTRIKYLSALAVLTALTVLALPSRSPIIQRARSIVGGTDSSEQVRTTMAIRDAYEIARSKDLLFGVGLGETKDYSTQFPTGRIASAVADTLSALGIAGLVLRFGLEVWFFCRSRPDRDPLRLSLFTWVFLWQFGGSFNGNIAEYLIWVLAFSESVAITPVWRRTGVRAEDYDHAGPGDRDCIANEA